MYKNLFATVLISGLATTLLGGCGNQHAASSARGSEGPSHRGGPSVDAAPAANAATSRLKCVTYRITYKGNTKYLKVHNGCAGRVDVDVQQPGHDTGYKLIAHGKTHTFTGGKGAYIYGLKIYYKGTRYYNHIGRQ